MAHPLIEVYNQFRTARLNMKYLECQIDTLKKVNFGFELLIGLSASADVAGIWLLQNEIGKIIWELLIGFTAIIAVVKPILDFSTKLQNKEEVYMGYKSLYIDIERIIVSVKQNQKYDVILKNRFLKIMEKKYEIVKIEGAEKINQKLLKKCFDEVNKEIPVGSFYNPKEKSYDLEIEQFTTTTAGSATNATNSTSG